MEIKLPNVRLAFPNLFRPQSVQGSDPKYGASFLIDPDTKAGSKLVAQIEDAMVEVANAKWGDKADKILKGLKKQGRVCLRDGDEKAEYDGFEGMMFVSATNAAKPTVTDRDPNEELTQADGKPYGGCFVYGYIELWAQDNDYGKRINASLKGVQFYKDGDAFSGGGVAKVEDFEDLSDLGEDDEDDDLA